MSHLLNETRNIDISLANQMSILITATRWRHLVVQPGLMNVTFPETDPHARAGLFHFNIFRIFDKNFRSKIPKNVKFSSKFL